MLLKKVTNFIENELELDNFDSNSVSDFDSK